MRGRFSAGVAEDEWCERRLLARIHRYTIKRLRAEIEPVAARDFLRFLLQWQHVASDSRMAGAKALDAVIDQLEGFGAPAGAWESEILPARIADYAPGWLDARCLGGQAAWTRLHARADAERRTGPVRTTPITLAPRRTVALWRSLLPADEGKPSAKARAVLDFITANGASFFDELVQHCGLLRSQVEEALAEVVALGRVTSDSFSGLRALLTPASERRPSRRRRKIVAMDETGRWSLVRSAPSDAAAVEHVARTLLRRYGVVFWRMLERESPWLPPWRELLRVLRRLESRGEIRGGRFVAGFTGEQFALPEAIGALRETRRRPESNDWTMVSGADPLNLAGILTPGVKLAALAGNRLLFQDGVPLAMLSAGEIRLFGDVDPATEWLARKALLGTRPKLAKASPLDFVAPHHHISANPR
jgi:ATP-dependent Lhr-like helicase